MEFPNSSIIWISYRSYTKGVAVQKHKHDFFHFIYVIEGVGSITIGNTTLTLTPGNLYLTPKEVEHSFFNSEEDILETYEIKFRLGREDTKAISAMPYMLDAVEGEIGDTLCSILRESQEEKPLSDSIIDLQFKLFLNYVLRLGEGAATVQKLKQKGASLEIEKTVSYILENLSKNPTLNELAKIAGFEKNYFLRKFRAQIGKTPLEFMRQKRIEAAKSLLQYSDLNVTQIAEELGFKSIHYFSKVFYEQTGIRPLKFRDEFYKNV